MDRLSGGPGSFAASVSYGEALPAVSPAMPPRPITDRRPWGIRNHSAENHAAFRAMADCEEPGQQEFSPGPFGQMASPVAWPGRAVIPRGGMHCLHLLFCERLGDQACLRDAPHEVSAAVALHLQDHRIIRVLAPYDHLDRPGCEVEGVIALFGLQSVNQPCSNIPNPTQCTGDKGWHCRTERDSDPREAPCNKGVHLAVSSNSRQVTALKIMQCESTGSGYSYRSTGSGDRCRYGGKRDGGKTVQHRSTANEHG